MRDFLILLIICACFGCTSANNHIGYSYSIESKFGSDVQLHHFLYIDRFLIQFNLRTNIESEINLLRHSKNEKVWYDTASVEVVDIRNRMLIQVDNLNQNFLINKTGSYPDSSDGLKLAIMINKENNQELPLADTIIGKDRYKFSRYEVKDCNGKDSLTGCFFWNTLPNFFSPFDFDNKYPLSINPCGFSIHMVKENYQVQLRIKEVLRLSEDESKKWLRLCLKIFAVKRR